MMHFKIMKRNSTELFHSEVEKNRVTLLLSAKILLFSEICSFEKFLLIHKT